jgi:hypothetical protein
MNATSLVAFAVLLVAFFGVLAYNAYSGQSVTYAPPYYFSIGDWLSYVNAFCFVFIFSMLFFGLGAPAAMAIEGVKYGVLYSVVPIYDMLFMVPEILAMLAASRLGEGVMADWSGEGNVYGYWREGFEYIAAGIVLLALLIILRPFILPLLG